MAIILDIDNVFDYLAKLDFWKTTDRQRSQIMAIPAKNFNLAVAMSDGKTLLVKQELHNDRGQTNGEFLAAWQMQQLVRSFPTLSNLLGDFLPELLHFDPDNSILIVNYLSDYIDLYKYYIQGQQFPVEITRSIGQLLATIHSQTFQQSQYQRFLDPNEARDVASKIAAQKQSYAHQIVRRLSRITPDIFRMMPPECLQFFRLYQRFPSLSQAIAELADAIVPSCVVHNDLKINNILLDLDWERPGSQLIKLIDWERTSWGDPAFDLGCLLGSYLEIWLDGLVISQTLSINESLQLATTPLELLQPSLATLVESYLVGFPAIAIARPDYLDRAIQFAGLALIQRIEITIDEDRFFGNRGIVMLQIAKQLICTPQSARNTLFGSSFVHAAK
jgi:Phosphotransferase enzyme family